MSVSTRRYRTRIYPYAGTLTNGRADSKYGAARSADGYFTRVSPVVGDERTVAGQADHLERCVFEYGDSVPVEVDDLIVHSGTQWKVESVTLRTIKRVKIVRAYRSDDQPDAVTG